MTETNSQTNQVAREPHPSPAPKKKKRFGWGFSSKTHAHEFLPAALEIMETPPSPIGRGILWFTVIFFTLALIWSSVGKVDVVAISQGKIVPTGRVKVIQPLEAGVIAHIEVEEGQLVGAGDVLVELDLTSIDADQRRLISELESAENNLQRQRQLLSLSRRGVDPDNAALSFSSGPDSAGRLIQQELLQDELRHYYADLEALDNTIKRREAEMGGTQALVNKYRATVPLIQTRSDALKRLLEQNLAAENDYLTLKQELLEQTHDLSAQQSRLAEIEAAIQESKSHRSARVAEFQTQILEKIAELDRQIRAIEEEHIKNRQRSVRQVLRAPVDGLVQQLAIHTLGGVVTPAQQLMVIVPQDQQLEVESWIQNKDIGFVKAGQDAVIKVEAFPFTKYGTIAGKLETISSDAIVDERLGLIYRAKVTMDRNDILVEGKEVILSSGMAVTVEVRTGDRRLIEYFLSPLLRFKDESVRER